MKKLLLITLILLATQVAIAAGPGIILQQEIVPVRMMIDKTVQITVPEPGFILLHRQFEGGQMDPSYTNDRFEGSIVINMTNNFPVMMYATINPLGPGLAVSNQWYCDIATFYQTLNYVGMTDVEFFHSAPAPLGQEFTLGAMVENVNIAMWPSDDMDPQDVAEILLTVVDDL